MTLTDPVRVFLEAVDGGRAHRDTSPPYLARVEDNNGTVRVAPQDVVDAAKALIQLDWTRADHFDVPWVLNDAGRAALGQLKEK